MMSNIIIKIMKTINKTKNHSANKHQKTWYKLDLSANVYPTLQRKNFSNVFRLSVVLKEEIDPDTLQKAVDLTLPRFPAFKVALRKGIFWRYLEPNDRPGPFVMPDIINPCMPMLFKSNNRYLIRIYYYRCRISLEVFHSLSDGSGALKLLKTITAVYLRLKGNEISNTRVFWISMSRRDRKKWKMPISSMLPPESNGPAARAELPDPGTQRTFLHPEYHPRSSVCAGSAAESPKLSCNSDRILKRSSSVCPSGKAKRGSRFQGISRSTGSSRESAQYFSIRHTAELYCHGVPFRRPAHG